MRLNQIYVDVNTTPIVSVDGIAEFTETTGAFYREYGKDADPLLEWAERSRQYIEKVRRQFGTRLRHIAVASKYRYGQFHEEQGWPPDKPHALDGLCVDDTYRYVSIDRHRPLTVIDKKENDATTSEEFMNVVAGEPEIMLVGVTGTSCIGKTVRSLLPKIAAREIALRRMIMAENGFASRGGRMEDHRRIVEWLGDLNMVRMTGDLKNIQWTDANP